MMIKEEEMIEAMRKWGSLCWVGAGNVIATRKANAYSLTDVRLVVQLVEIH